MNKNCQFIRDIVHIIDLISLLSRKAEKKIMILDFSDISRSIAAEIHPRSVNTSVSALDSSASHAGSSSESESRPMTDGKAPRKTVPQSAATEMKVGHKRKDHE